MIQQQQHDDGALDEAINNFKHVVTTLDMTNQDSISDHKRRETPKTDSGLLKSSGLISRLQSTSPPCRPPPPADYSPSPPAPPTRTSASNINNLKTKQQAPPAPPTKSEQTEAAYKRLQNQLRESNKNEAVKNLSNLMSSIEKFNAAKNDVDDLESKLDNLTDKLLNAFDGKNDEVEWQNGKPSMFNSCHGCGELIKEDTILAGPHHYHQECFSCEHCNVSLGDNFYSVNGKNFCVQHKDVSLQHCSVCQDLISDGGLLISDQYYHLHCFTCTSCHQVLDGTYYTTDQGFLCKQCYLDTLAKCVHCHLSIKDRIIRVKETQYHPDCFNCHLCACNLDGVPFLQLEDSINCVDCYKRYKAVRCARCGEGITEENISCNGQHYHKQCYTCHDCGKSLLGEFVCNLESEIICFMCDTKRRSGK